MALVRSRGWRTLIAATAVIASAASGCSDDSETRVAAVTSTTSSSTETDSLRRYCDAVHALEQQEATNPAELNALYGIIEADAPVGIQPQAKRFAQLGREVSAASSRIGSDPSEAQVQAAVESLSPDAAAFLESIVQAAQTGETDHPIVSEVLTYSLTRCTEAGDPAEFQPMGSSIEESP